MDIGEDECFQLLMVVSGINFVMLLDEILCVVERLLDVMECLLDEWILGKQIICEIFYYVLMGLCGGVLFVLVSCQMYFSLISCVFKQIEMKYIENLNVE